MTFRSSREIAAPPSKVFAAFEDPVRVALWWGPAGFSNAFETFEFAPDGKWSFVITGPDGKNYPNEIVVTDIEPDVRIGIHHVSPPRYLLTVTLEPSSDGGTLVTWNQEFENPDVGRRLERIVVPANEELLERLSSEVTRIG